MENRAVYLLGQTITILGGGSIGMCTLLSAEARGASRIIQEISPHSTGAQTILS